MELTANQGVRAVVIILLSLAIVSLVWVGFRVALPEQITLFAGNRPDNLGVNSGQLAPCPKSPNCVSSQSQDAEHSIEPLTYKSTPEAAFADLKTIVQSLERTKIITETADYLYVEFTSKLIGFVDDVEFYLDKTANLIQVRSASRLGESDLGVNRQRVETIRTKLQEFNHA